MLLPSAVMTLLEYLAFTTFSAKMVDEGRSAFAERMGTQVASPLVNIADDAPAHRPMTLPFDGEGTPTQRVDLIVGGVAAGVVHDRASAAAAGVASTGHGLPGPNPFGPFAGSLVLAPGTSSLDDLVAGVDRGLLVTRFWYTRTVNPKKTLITGMTRDGTFRIDGGEVGPPVRNLRYNVSILDAWPAATGWATRLRTSSDESGDSRAPGPPPALVPVHLVERPLSDRPRPPATGPRWPGAWAWASGSGTPASCCRWCCSASAWPPGSRRSSPPTIVLLLVAGSLTLLPAIILGYAVRTAEREDRARGL